jgi:hypothetical protein
MARQKGILPLQGTMGNITFYKSKDGYLAREKGGIPAERIATDPAFQRTRENGAEFGRAGVAGKLLRTSMRALIASAADSRMVGRLTQAFVKVIQADATSVRGERNVIDGEAEMLKGFEFNQVGKLGATFYAPFTSTINRVSGDLTVDIPSFVPINMIAAPAGATHFNLISGGSAVDFEDEVYAAATVENGILPIDGIATAAIALTSNVGAASTMPLFLVLGIVFYQEINGAKYILRNGSYNALAIVDVSGL